MIEKKMALNFLTLSFKPKYQDVCGERRILKSAAQKEIRSDNSHAAPFKMY